MIISIPSVVYAVSEQSLEAWSDITTIYSFSERWQYTGDQGIRIGLTLDDFISFYFRPSVQYRIRPKLTLHGGVGFFQSFLPDDEKISELRPWQGLRYLWPEIGGYAFSHYVRLEQRMISSTGERSDLDSTLRSRYKFGVRTPTYHVLFNNGIFLTGSVEIFWNMKDTFTLDFSNRIRWDIGIGTIFTSGLKAELHYILQDGRGTQQDSFTEEEHILRLRFFYQFR
jgi:hypothetical protein